MLCKALIRKGLCDQRQPMLSGWRKIPRYWRVKSRRCCAASFVLHPFTDEIRAQRDPKGPVFPFDKKQQCGAVEFFKVGETEHRPQPALPCGMDELIEIRKMPLK